MWCLGLGLWIPLLHLLWTERTVIGVRFWVRLTILLLRTAYDTLSDTKRILSRISTSVTVLHRLYSSCRSTTVTQGWRRCSLMHQSWRGTLPTADPGELLVSPEHPYNATPKHFLLCSFDLFFFISLLSWCSNVVVSWQSQSGDAGSYSRFACTPWSRPWEPFSQKDLVCLGIWNTSGSGRDAVGRIRRVWSIFSCICFMRVHLLYMCVVFLLSS